MLRLSYKAKLVSFSFLFMVLSPLTGFASFIDIDGVATIAKTWHEISKFWVISSMGVFYATTRAIIALRDTRIKTGTMLSKSIAFTLYTGSFMSLVCLSYQFKDVTYDIFEFVGDFCGRLIN